jgi:hypothetical protein
MAVKSEKNSNLSIYPNQEFNMLVQLSNICFTKRGGITMSNGLYAPHEKREFPVKLNLLFFIYAY